LEEIPLRVRHFSPLFSPFAEIDYLLKISSSFCSFDSLKQIYTCKAVFHIIYLLLLIC
jgi:hypothetical protein